MLKTIVLDQLFLTLHLPSLFNPQTHFTLGVSPSLAQIPKWHPHMPKNGESGREGGNAEMHRLLLKTLKTLLEDKQIYVYLKKSKQNDGHVT